MSCNLDSYYIKNAPQCHAALYGRQASTMMVFARDVRNAFETLSDYARCQRKRMEELGDERWGDILGIGLCMCVLGVFRLMCLRVRCVFVCMLETAVFVISPHSVRPRARRKYEIALERQQINSLRYNIVCICLTRVRRKRDVYCAYNNIYVCTLLYIDTG